MTTYMGAISTNYRDQFGIAALGVRGFKSLYDESRIDIKPLTILAGANSSGKSSIMQPLLMLRQTLQSTFDPGSLLLSGPHVEFSRVDQFLSSAAIATSTAKQLEVTVELLNGNIMTLLFTHQTEAGIALKRMTYFTPEAHGTLDDEATEQDIEAAIPESRRVTGRSEPMAAGRWEVQRERCFLRAVMVASGPEARAGLGLAYSPGNAFNIDVQFLIHIGGIRGVTGRAYPMSDSHGPLSGRFEPYVGSIIGKWQNQRDWRIEKLAEGLTRLGLTSAVSATPVSDTHLEVRVARAPVAGVQGPHDLVNVADVGLGVSQVLPLVVALLYADPGQLVYVEQPEIHLHPRAQVALAQLLAEAALRGVRIVAETHSSLLILAVQALVAEGMLPADLVKLHWFRRRDDGSTEITSADLDETGAFGDWPEDFDDVTLAAQSRYLDAADARLSRR